MLEFNERNIVNQLQHGLDKVVGPEIAKLTFCIHPIWSGKGLTNKNLMTKPISTNEKSISRNNCFETKNAIPLSNID